MKAKLKYLITIIAVITLIGSVALGLTACNAEPDDDKYVQETTRFYINELSVLNLPVGLVLDKKSSYFELRPDGTMSIYVMLKEGAAMTLESLQQEYDIDLSTFNVQSIVDQYAASLMPGFTLDDVEFSIGLLDDVVGMSFVGLDMEHEGVKELVDTLETTKHLPKKISLPSKFGVCYEGSYHIEEVTSDLTGESYKAVYTGESAPNGEPFVIMTMYENKDGTTSIYLRIEFIMLEVRGVTK